MVYFVESFCKVKIDNINLPSFFKYVEKLVTDIQHLRSSRSPSKKTVLKLEDLLMNVINKTVLNTTFEDFRDERQ